MRPVKHTTGNDPELLTAGLEFSDPARPGAAGPHGPAHQRLAVVDAGLLVQLGREGQLGVALFGLWLPVAEQLSTAAHQLQHLLVERGGVEILQAQHSE